MSQCISMSYIQQQSPSQLNIGRTFRDFLSVEQIQLITIIDK